MTSGFGKLGMLGGLLLFVLGCGGGEASAAASGEPDAGSAEDGSAEDGSAEDGSAVDTPIGDAGGDAVGAADTFVYAAKPIAPKLLGEAILVIAHRGGRTERPGHTQAAYTNAVAVGTDLLEMDLHRTKDGVLVAMHDATVDRTTNGKGAIKDLTWAEIAKLDAGYTWSPDGGKTYPYRGKGLRVARADETLKRFPDMLFSVELKQLTPSIAADVAALFKAYDAVHRTVFVSFSDEVMVDLRKRLPTAPSAMALGEMVTLRTLSDEDLKTYKPPCRFVQAPLAQVDAKLMQVATKFGLRIQPWTANKKADLQAMIDLKVHGLFTDDPALLRSLLP